MTRSVVLATLLWLSGGLFAVNCLGQAKPPAETDRCAGAKDICISFTPKLVLDDSTGSGMFKICNPLNTTPSLMLVLTDFMAGEGANKHQIAVSSKLEAVRPSDARFVGGDASPPQGCILVRLTVDHFLEAGAATAELWNSNNKLTDIEVHRNHVPFTISFDSTTVIHVYGDGNGHGGKAAIPLKNADSITYPISGTLRVKDTQCELVDENGRTPVFLPANSSVTAFCALDDRLFDLWRNGRLKDESVNSDLMDKNLLVRLERTDGTVDKAQQLWFPVSLVLSFYPQGRQPLHNLGWLLFLLLIGALLSLVTTNGLPNELRKMDDRRRLSRIYNQIQPFEKELDDLKLVDLLSVERKRLGSMADSYVSVAPDAAANLDQVELGITALEYRVDAASRVARVHQLLIPSGQNTVPPTQIDRIRPACRIATELLESSKLSASDQTLLAAKLDEIDQWERGLGLPDPELEANIKTREATFLGIFAPTTAGGPLAVPAGTWQVFFTEPDDFEPLKRLATASASAPEPANYFERDACLLTLGIKKAFVDLHDFRPSWRPNLDKHLPELRSRLDAKDFVRARWMIGEMQQNIYVENLLDALQAPREDRPPVRISAPSQVRVQEAVTFSIVFRDASLNGATALNEIRSEWVFGDHTTTAVGWDATHFFSSWMRGKRMDGTRISEWLNKRRISALPGGTKGYLVTARFGFAETTIEPLIRPIRVTGDALWARTRVLLIEILRLAVPLFIAIIGLQALALTTLQKSDALAGALLVIAVGFGADTVKNAFSAPRRG